MCLNFILTSEEIRYPYYLAIVSAQRAHPGVPSLLWSVLRPRGDYFDVLKSSLEVRRVGIPRFNSLDHFTHPNHRCSMEKDYIQWVYLWETGGLYLDLDTFTLQPMLPLLAGRESVLQCSHPPPYGDPPFYCTDSGIVLGQPGCELLTRCRDAALEAFKKSHLVWAETGPTVLALQANAMRERIDFRPFGELNGGGWWDAHRWYTDALVEEYPLPDFARGMHLTASQNLEAFAEIQGPDYIAGRDNTYTRAVKRTLAPGDWDPLGLL
jgi:hypothetical protein